MSDNKNTVAKSTTNVDKGFKLKPESILEGGVEVVVISRKKSVLLNRGKLVCKHLKKGERVEVQPASSTLLKQIYDSNPTYEKIIQAPKNYKAPWHKD